jgi:type I restriction enzyme, S subunit
VCRILAARGERSSGRSKPREPIPPSGELDELPKGWCWATVDQLAEVGTGATPNRSKAVYYEGGSVPWVTSSVVNAPYVDAASEFVTSAALEQTNLTLYPPGTLLVAMYGEGKTRGKCSELRIAAATNQALAALQADAAFRPYLKLFLEHNYEATRKVATGGVQPNLNLGLVRAIKVPLPPIAEQHRIVAEVDRRLSIVREVEAEIGANLKRAQALRQAVLAKAFSTH